MFITAEGGEGSGKSSVVPVLAEYIRKTSNKKVITINDPGGCALSNDIRKILLTSKNSHMCKATELFLYQAARAQLTEEIILPALKDDTIVISDRFYDSTTIYQGYVRGWDLKILRTFKELVAPNLTPTLTFLLDIDPKVGLARSKKKAEGVAVDEVRFENEKLEFHRQVRKGFLSLYKLHAHESSKRNFILIEIKDKSLEQVCDEVIDKFNKFLTERK